MIVLLTHDADAATIQEVLRRIEELDLRAVTLDTRRGRALEILGSDRGRALSLRGTPGVEEILTRRTALVGGEPVWPHFTLRVAMLTTVVLVVLAGLTAFLPPGLGDPVGGIAPQVTEVEAMAAVEWYLRPSAMLMSLFGSERQLLAGAVAMLAWLALLFWPFIDRTKKKPTTSAGTTLFVLALVLGLAPPAGAQMGAQAGAQAGAHLDPMPSCATHCHGEQQVEFTASAHALTLACTDCHGGDPGAQRDKDASHAADAGFVGSPPREDIPRLCGECHADPLRMFAHALPTDQLATYRTSQHGLAVLQRGDTSAAVCTDCHGSHEILGSHDTSAPTHRLNQPATCATCHEDAERMLPHGLPTGVVAEFASSVHGKALLDEQARGAPTCADCHGSHGAAPPGVESLVHVCASCHVNTAEAYRESPHAATPDMRCGACHEGADEIPGGRQSGCAACHGTHGIGQPGEWMFTGEEVGHCGHCHREDNRAEAVIAAITDGTGRLRATMDDTLSEIRAGKARGLFLEHEQTYLRESMRTLVSVQPLSHSMDVEAITARLEDGIKRQDRTREQVRKQGTLLRDRKILLGGGALVMLMLAGLFAVKLDALRKLS
jgi:hypothetical protein